MPRRKNQEPGKVYPPHSIDEVKGYLGFRVWRSEDRQIHTELLVEWADSDYSHQWTHTTEEELPSWTEAEIVSQVILLGENYAEPIRELFSSQFPYENKCLEVYIRGDQALIGVSLAPVKVDGVYLQLSLADPDADEIPSVPGIRKITKDVEVDEDGWITTSGTTQTTMEVRQVRRTTWRKIRNIRAEGAQLENTKFEPTLTLAEGWVPVNASSVEKANFELELAHIRANDAHMELKKRKIRHWKKRRGAVRLSDRNEQPESNEEPDFNFYKSLFDITVWSDSCCDDNCTDCTETSKGLDHFLVAFSQLFPSIFVETFEFLKIHFFKVLTGESFDEDELFDGFNHLHCYFCPDEADNNSAAEKGKKSENVYQLYLNCSYCELLIDCLVAVGQMGKDKEEEEVLENAEQSVVFKRVRGIHKEVLENTGQPIGLSDEVFELLRGIVCDAIASKKKNVEDNEFKQLAFPENISGLTPLSLVAENNQKREILSIYTSNDNGLPLNEVSGQPSQMDIDDD